MAERGFAAVGLTTRYAGNDSNLRTENCLLDIGSMVTHLRERGYEKIVLVGNSGGASIAPYYQAQAENPSVSNPPGGGPDLTAAALPPVDAVCMLMAHSGRPRLITEWLDPSIYDESRPFDRDPALDIYNTGSTLPFSAEFVERYRSGQTERNHRITRWAQSMLRTIDDSGPAGLNDFPFVVYGTYADPRALDAELDPNDREVGVSLWGPPAATNYFPAALGRYTTARSWLNQWSLEYALGDSLRWLPEVSVPVHIVYGTADNAAHSSHSTDMYAAVTGAPRKITAIEGATHYFSGQPSLLAHACDALATWAKNPSTESD
ncbi:alpha/beta hydrolase [Rhodococcus erythropolis]|uniref:alpha/beta hydrolase n=1 Tax=Rhodococcus erythropolis TaxID=1833 RepID=UPI002226F6FC|nr:alpha/beta hydrolase [Rhodococcus erythropolis]MCW2295371.1 pimeloyl-ACP methyl ester carboxylesterase [Rhodococcus erythropolis]